LHLQIQIKYNGTLLDIMSRNGASDGVIRFGGHAGGNFTEYARFASSGRLGIGTSSPSVDLHVEGNALVTGNLTVNGNLTFGNAATDTVSFGADIDSHIIPDDDDTYDLGSSTQRWRNLYIDGVASLDQVGIGTDSPSLPLHLNGGTNNQIALFESTDATVKLGFKDNSTTNNYSVTIGATGDEMILSSGSGGDERLRIDSSGNVGIGTSSPSVPLHVYRTGNADLYLERASGARVFGQAQASAGVLGTNTNHRLDIKTNGTTRMTLDTSGNVGIGTGSPDTSLHVVGSGSTYMKAERTVSGSEGYLLLGAATNQNQIISRDGADSNKDLTFTIGATERMRIDSSGNLLVGKTATASTTVGAEIRPEGRLFGTTDNQFCLLLNRTNTDGDIAVFRKDGTTVGTIGSSFGNRLFIGDGDTAIRFADDLDTIVPWNASTNALRDNAIDLGEATGRFKDLYLGGNATIGGNLTVSGTTTTIDTTNLNVEDKNITINYSTGDSSSTADGAGITIQDAVDASTDATILWDATNDEFDFSHSIDVTGQIELGDGHLIGDDDFDNLALVSSSGENLLLGSANDLYFKTNATSLSSSGNTRMYISGTNGRVGIGTLTPSSKLHVSGDSDASTKLTIERTGATTGTNVLGYNYVGTFSNSELRLFANSSERMRIDTSGNVGIGTTSPSEKLYVKGSVNNDDVAIKIENNYDDNLSTSRPAAALQFATASNNAHLRVFGAPADTAANHQIDLGSTAASSFITLSPAGSEAMRIDSSGNVGIGTNSPEGRLHIANFQTTDQLVLERTGSSSAKFSFNTFSDSITIVDEGGGSGAERMRIDSSGNVGIGTTSPSEKLELLRQVRS
jgi:hypothetical protein